MQFIPPAGPGLPTWRLATSNSRTEEATNQVSCSCCSSFRGPKKGAKSQEIAEIPIWWFRRFEMNTWNALKCMFGKWASEKVETCCDSKYNIFVGCIYIYIHMHMLIYLICTCFTRCSRFWVSQQLVQSLKCFNRQSTETLNGLWPVLVGSSFVGFLLGDHLWWTCSVKSAIWIYLIGGGHWPMESGLVNPTLQVGAPNAKDWRT